MTTRRPLIGLVCCNEVAERAIQAVASRFLAPLARVSDASVLLVPAAPDTIDLPHLAGLLDGLLLTGSRSHVSPERYGGAPLGGNHVTDPARDEVALGLAGRMIEAGKPVFGICRGLQEINVLFGGTLSQEACGGRHLLARTENGYDAQFAHRHKVDLLENGRLAAATGTRTIVVNSVHEQCIDRLGTGLLVEAISTDDGLIEAVRAPSSGAEVLAVQWHPEWDCAAEPTDRMFFELFGSALRSQQL